MACSISTCISCVAAMVLITQVILTIWKGACGSISIGCEWTRSRRPVQLLWYATVPSREEAIAFERRIKGWSRAKKEALIRMDWDRINWLSRAPHERPSTARFALRSGRKIREMARERTN